jgi:hypothetical protein
MTPDEKIRLGQAAERLLLDETFTAAFDTLEAHYRAAVFKEGLNVDDREALFAEYRGFQRARKVLQHWKSDGMKAADEVKKG